MRLTHNRWDAYFFGARKPIPSPPAPPEFEGRLESFHRRPPYMQDPSRSRFIQQKKFKDLAEHITFGISSGRTHPADGFPIKAFHAITLPMFWDGRTRIYVSYEDVAPLLSRALTTSERLMSQYYVADSLVHELAVRGNTLLLGTELTIFEARHAYNGQRYQCTGTIL